MYAIGFYRIKSITVLLFAIAFVVVTYLGCSFLDKDINCNAKLILKVINNTASTKRIEFSNFEESYKPDFVTITFSDATASIGQQESRTFVFEHSWMGNNECVFGKGLFERHRVDVTIKNGDSAVAHYQVYPFDTTKVFQSICTNCVHEYLDSLVLK